ncbi:MAG: hypothetical protein IH608_10520 [Proteobacteria bacterium]|nr:hypothetical protein [Pseudomonadota bacterium]
MRVRSAVFLIVVVLALAWFPARGWGSLTAEEFVQRMASAYARVRDYRMRLRSGAREGEGEPEETRLPYSFQ